MCQAEISSIHLLFPIFWSCRCHLESLLRFEACRGEWEWAIHLHCGWLSHQGNLHTSDMKPNSKGLKMKKLGETNQNLPSFLTNGWWFFHEQSFHSPDLIRPAADILVGLTLAKSLLASIEVSLEYIKTAGSPRTSLPFIPVPSNTHTQATFRFQRYCFLVKVRFSHNSCRGTEQVCFFL